MKVWLELESDSENTFKKYSYTHEHKKALLHRQVAQSFPVLMLMRRPAEPPPLCASTAELTGEGKEVVVSLERGEG